MNATTSRRRSVRKKLPAPPCPCCLDQFNVMSLLHAPERLYCFSCNSFFTVKDLVKAAESHRPYLSKAK